MAAWPANAQLPNAVLTVAVRDGRGPENRRCDRKFDGWQKHSRNNAEYYTAPTRDAALESHSSRFRYGSWWRD